MSIANPTCAMLWEIWGKHKYPFLWQIVALTVSTVLVSFKGGATRDVAAFLFAGVLCPFLAALVHLMMCFGYIENDTRRAENGYPARLLLKPLSTARLALTPMFFGALVIVVFFLIWYWLVLQRMLRFPGGPAFWTGGVILSFFWWTQSVTWSLPLAPGRTGIVLATAIIHLLVGILPPTTGGLAVWHWLILAVLLGAAPAAAIAGLDQMRHGSWEGSNRLAALAARLKSSFVRDAVCRVPIVSGLRRPFRSAFGAQFWLEWRRHGAMLPWVTAGMTILVMLFAWISRPEVEERSSVAPAIVLLCLPLLVSGAIAPGLGKFDPVQASPEVPVFVAIRPISNGGLVWVKLAMALASSAVTWLITVMAVGLWAIGSGKASLGLLASAGAPHGPVAILVASVPMLLLLILWTWKNLVAGIAPGLAGRPWVMGVFTAMRVVTLGGIVCLALAAKLYGFGHFLWRWAPALLLAGLALKLSVSAAAIGFALRQKAITPGAACWIAGGWLLSGVFVAGYAGLVCVVQNKTELLAWIIPAGFLVLPLCDLVIAPLALAWNRHR
jgi:hypothetical protein